MTKLDHLSCKFLLACSLLVIFSCQVTCVDVPSATVSSKISKAIIKYLTDKDPTYVGKKIEISFKYADKTFRDLKARKGSVDYFVAELYPDFRPIGNIIVPIQVVVDGVQKEKIFLRTKVSVFEKIIVANKRFKRGDVILEGDASVDTRDVAVLSSDVIRDASVVMGKEVKTYIPKGNPIYVWMIKERPFVRKNEKVKINLRANNITVVANGLSLEDGLFGSEVRIKNLYTGREIVGMVTGTGEVEVK